MYWGTGVLLVHPVNTFLNLELDPFLEPGCTGFWRRKIIKNLSGLWARKTVLKLPPRGNVNSSAAAPLDLKTARQEAREKRIYDRIHKSCQTVDDLEQTNYT